MVEEPRGGLDEAFVVGRVAQVAGRGFSGKGVDGCESGRDVALGRRSCFTASVCSEILQQHQTLGVLRCGLELLGRE